MIKKALEFAQEKHKKQTRKVTQEPYMKHLYDVAEILKQEKCSDIVITAGILHDTLEDTQTTEEELFLLFGEEVLEIVKCETENKALPYKERKQEKITQLETCDRNVKLVKCADMLSNITDMKAALELVGESLWDYFNGTKETFEWYYKSMLNSMKEIQELEMYKRLALTVKDVFGV